MKHIFVVFTLLASPALGDDVQYVMPEIPDEATKRAALLFAYELNGNSMVRHPSLGSIDLTGPLPKADRITPLVKDQKGSTSK